MAKSFWGHYYIFIIWRQDHRQEKQESKQTMALEVVYRKQWRTENETVVFHIFIILFRFLQDYADCIILKKTENYAEIDLELLPFIFGGPK